MEAAMQGWLLEVLRLEREEDMAKTAAKPAIPASLSPSEAIRVLRTVYERGNALMLKRPLEQKEADAWTGTGHEMLIRAFGSSSHNVQDFRGIAFYRSPRVDTPAGREELSAEILGERLSVVGSCIEQLELITGEAAKAPGVTAAPGGDRVFIGHGGNLAWMVVKDFMVDRLHLNYEEFNREATAGISTAERLQKMLDESAFALIVMTGEDEHQDGKQHARESVIHEAGLFQGRLGFRRTIILLEEGCEEFSNIEGVTQIRFKKGQISATFEEIRRTLEREGVLAK
jgi:predicted nucleotide-binding protein